MPTSIDAMVQGFVRQQLLPAIPRAVQEQLDQELWRRERGGSTRGTPSTQSRGARLRPEEQTKWVADGNARRVPRFVIEATGGLDTKRKIVARFGENAVFEKGKPLPLRKGPAATASRTRPSASRAERQARHGR